MKEGIEGRSAELNEAELANVSGGEGIPSNKEFYDANHKCTCQCDRKNRCGHSIMELAQYIHDNGTIQHFSLCPFYKEAGKE